MSQPLPKDKEKAPTTVSSATDNEDDIIRTLSSLACHTSSTQSSGSDSSAPRLTHSTSRFVDVEAGCSDDEYNDHADDLDEDETELDRAFIDGTPTDEQAELVEHQRELFRQQNPNPTLTPTDIGNMLNSLSSSSSSTTPVTTTTTAPPTTTSVIANIPDEVEPLTGSPLNSDATHPNRFRLRHKKIGLTYAQCSVKPQDMCDHLRITLGSYEPQLIIVAQEQHNTTDGLHLHAYVSLSKTLSTENVRIFDYNMFHPNIRTIMKEKGWIAYVTKGNNYVAYPAWYRAPTQQPQPQRHGSVLPAICDAIKKTPSYYAIAQLYPSFALLHGHQLKDYINEVNLESRRKELRARWRHVARFVGDGCLNNQRIAGWLNDHVLKPQVFRGINLWIHAPTKSGKSALAYHLGKLGCDILNVDLSSTFFDGISESTQLLVFDEFKAQKTITEMNKLSDGSLCRVQVKGSSFQFTKPIACLVLSNFSISEAYHNSDQLHLETLKGRYIEIKCEQHIVVNWIGEPMDDETLDRMNPINLDDVE